MNSRLLKAIFWYGLGASAGTFVTLTSVLWAEPVFKINGWLGMATGVFGGTVVLAYCYDKGDKAALRVPPKPVEDLIENLVHRGKPFED